MEFTLVIPPPTYPEQVPLGSLSPSLQPFSEKQQQQQQEELQQYRYSTTGGRRRLSPPLPVTQRTLRLPRPRPPPPSPPPTSPPCALTAVAASSLGRLGFGGEEVATATCAAEVERKGRSAGQRQAEAAEDDSGGWPGCCTSPSRQPWCTPQRYLSPRPLGGLGLDTATPARGTYLSTMHYGQGGGGAWGGSSSCQGGGGASSSSSTTGMLSPAAALRCEDHQLMAMTCTPVKFQVAVLPKAVTKSWTDKVAEVMTYRKLPLRDKPNLVLPGLFLGSCKHATKSKVLKFGFTHILNCASSSSSSSRCGKGGLVEAEQLGLSSAGHYLALDAQDSPTFPILKVFWEDAFTFLTKAQQNGGTTLIHCQAGVNRSAALAVAFVMVTTRMSLLQAVRHVFQQRPFILTNEFFHKELVEFAAQHNLLSPSSSLPSESTHLPSSPTVTCYLNGEGCTSRQADDPLLEAQAAAAGETVTQSSFTTVPL